VLFDEFFYNDVISFAFASTAEAISFLIHFHFADCSAL
jgi:hypothetical protein